MSIRILHFEPSLLDAQVVWLTLKSDELNPDVEHVESFEEFEEALQEQSFDLVICEYALQKRKTANDVIAYLKSKSIQLPVIVFSKVTDETVVEETLKHGASDYVFKSHLKFLATSIKEVLNRKTDLKPEAKVATLSEEFLKNLEALRTQLTGLQSPLAETQTTHAAEKPTQKQPAQDSQTAPQSSAMIEQMQKQINELTETINKLNTDKAELQGALEQAQAQVQSLKELKESSDKKITELQTQLEQTLQTLNEVTEALKIAQEQATLSAAAYEEERQANTRLKAENLEKAEQEKKLINELDKAHEVEMQLRIELQEAVIVGNQLQDATKKASEQLAELEAMFKQYDAALHQQVSNANQLNEQIQTAQAELTSAQEEKQSLESKLIAAQEAAQSLVQRFTKQINELRAKLDEEISKREKLEQELNQQPKGDPEKEAKLEAELAEAKNTISQLRADWEQANRTIERLENDVKILESGFQEKANKLLETQKELRAKERTLAEKSAILDAINLAIVMVSGSGQIRYWNAAASVFHGIPASQALGKTSDEIMKYKYASAKERKEAMEALQSVGRWSGKIKYLTPEGEQKMAEMFVARLNDEGGKPLGILTLLTDITKRTVIEDEYRNFKQHIEPMLNAAPISLITFDDAGIITGVFGKSIDQQHLAPSIGKGKSIYQLYGKYPQLLAAFRRVLSGEPVATSMAVSDLQVDFHFSPIFSNGAIAGAVGALVEVKAPVEQA